MALVRCIMGKLLGVVCHCFSLKYFTGAKIARNEMKGHVARMGERRDIYRVLVGKPEGRPRCR